MIENIQIENFKSIVKDDITLHNLTVIIGANGSGKSNLIKAIEFLATIPERGMAAAVVRQGGFEGIIPKVIPRNLLQKQKVKFDYTVRLPSPRKYSKELPPITVQHSFELGYSKDELVRIIREEMVFNQVIESTRASKQTDEENKEALLPEKITKSKFSLELGPRGGYKWKAIPSVNNENVKTYLEWLGFPFAVKKSESKSSFISLLNSMRVEEDSRGTHKRQLSQRLSILDPRRTTVIDLAPQARRFQRVIRGIQRYDLLLGELRRDQRASTDRILNSDGTNMPAVLGYLKDDQDRKDSWKRLLRTLCEVAPHIKSIDQGLVATGNKEYVKFVESIAARAVESWEASDGTLRALAILLALETSPSGTSVLVEEPEQNLHPWAIRSIMEHVREVVEVRKLQVIITTHSQQVLEAVNADEVLVATRTLEHGTKFKKIKEIVPESNIEAGELGRLWVKGLLSGVPSYE